MVVRALLGNRNRLLRQAPVFLGVGLEQTKHGENRQSQSFNLAQAGGAGRASQRPSFLEVGAHRLGAADYPREEAVGEKRDSFFMLVAAGSALGRHLPRQERAKVRRALATIFRTGL